MKNKSNETDTNTNAPQTRNALAEKTLCDLCRKLSDMSALNSEILRNIEDNDCVIDVESDDFFAVEVFVNSLYVSTAEIIRETGGTLDSNPFVSAVALSPFRGFTPTKANNRA